MKPASLSYSRPRSLSAALDEMQQRAEHARVIAGGQSLGPLMNFRLAQPRHLIDISRLADLSTATAEGDTLAVGACITHAAVEDGDIPDVTIGLMPHLARGIAYRAVRNRGTIGGSMAHADPAADWLTAMIALDASVRLQSARRLRQLKVSDFVLGPLETAIEAGEVITHVIVPRLSPGARWGTAKYARKSGDFAESMAVAAIDRSRNQFRVVLGRRAHLPALMERTSQLLRDRSDAAGTDELDTAITADLHGLAVYPGDLTMHRAIVTRAVRRLAA